MNFDWNSETIGWYTDANDYTGFYKKIAADIAPSLSGCRSLADFGCGPGLFDFEIFPHVETIDCIDMSDPALQSIRTRAERLGIGNITATKADCYELTGQWDAIYMSFFGTSHLDHFLSFCKQLYTVVSVTGDSEMFPMKQHRRRRTVEDMTRFFDDKQISYELAFRQYEFGQPYRSQEEAVRCLRHYAPGLSDGETAAYLKDRLVETGDRTFPYYAPRQKAVGIFQLDGRLG